MASPDKCQNDCILCFFVTTLSRGAHCPINGARWVAHSQGASLDLESLPRGRRGGRSWRSDLLASALLAAILGSWIGIARLSFRREGKTLVFVFATTRNLEIAHASASINSGSPRRDAR